MKTPDSPWHREHDFHLQAASAERSTRMVPWMLLDREMDHPAVQDIREVIESLPASQAADSWLL